MEIKPIFLKPEIHPKKWGEEQWLCNNEEFCGKILKFNKDAQFSAHQHVKKREVFYIFSGEIELMTINPSNAAQSVTLMKEGDIVEIPRFLVHRIEAKTDAIIFEFSTHHDETDSLRVLPGDSQKDL
jgi:mannose-6-phosphate isomerase-like protein (cupin superfamily)